MWRRDWFPHHVKLSRRVYFGQSGSRAGPAGLKKNSRETKINSRAHFPGEPHDLKSRPEPGAPPGISVLFLSIPAPAGDIENGQNGG